MAAKKIISEFQFDALRETVNIGVGRAAALVSEMLDREIILSIPNIEIYESLDILEQNIFKKKENLSAVGLDFQGVLNGTAKVLFDTLSASRLVELLIPGANSNQAEVHEISASTLTEIGNIVLNSVMGTLSNSLDLELDYLVPTYDETNNVEFRELLTASQQQLILLGETALYINEQEIKGRIMFMMNLDEIKDLLERWYHDC